MSMIGLLGLLVAFAGCVISVLCLGVAHILYKKRSFERSDTFAWGGPKCLHRLYYMLRQAQVK